MIAILGAMQAELDSLLKAIENPSAETVSGYTYYKGKIGGHDVVIGKCGVGKVNAAVCTQTLLMTYRPKVVINTGVAGSLSPTLDILDVVVATDAVQHDYDTTGIGEPAGALTINDEFVTALPCDEAWRNRLLAVAKRVGVRAVAARVASGDQFITKGEDKRRIVETFAASACEMEGAAIAQTCYLSNTPCAILRAISDSTDDNHHMEFAAFLNKAAENTFRILMEALNE